MKKQKINFSFANCLCGEIKVKIMGKLRNIINCHCTQCMKTHGNYASYTSCEESDLIFIKKKTLKWFTSSLYAKRGFCINCGASFFYKKINSNKISIAAGMFKNPTNLKTQTNIFVKNKMDYYKLDLKLPKYNEYIK